MDLARVSSKGQITIPISIRKKLNLKEGDTVLFVEENGKIVIVNSSYVALKEMHEIIEGESEKTDLISDEDVNHLIKNLRQELLEGKNEGNN